MNIDIDYLKSKGATCRQYQKNEIVFYEHEMAKYYYQIREGAVKMFNDNQEGKQFLQGIFGPGNSFGEPPLLINTPYPSTAITLSKSVIIRMPKEDFIEMIQKNQELENKLLSIFAMRLYNKAVTSRQIVNHCPESRILSFLNSYKKKSNSLQKEVIPYTRQMIADFTGLRVETVIRTLIRMKDMQKIEIVNRKIVY